MGAGFKEILIKYQDKKPISIEDCFWYTTISFV